MGKLLDFMQTRNFSQEEAVLDFQKSDYRIVKKGQFVRCAVTNEPIPLEALRYWDAEKQEAYSGIEAILQRIRAAANA